MANLTHTPLPWQVNGCFIDGPVGSNAEPSGEWNSVARVYGPDWQANAELIVRACNVHADLLAALEDALDKLKHATFGNQDVDAQTVAALFPMQAAAIKKARGEAE